MAGDEWDKRPDGNVVVQPVLGYAVATLPKAALLRVVYAATQADFDARLPSAVQLAMTPQIARAMARTLDQIADAIEPRPPEPGEALPPNAVAAPPMVEIAAPASTTTARLHPAGPGEFGYSIGDDPEELAFNYRG